jgi:hypothetical protein
VPRPATLRDPDADEDDHGGRQQRQGHALAEQQRREDEAPETGWKNWIVATGDAALGQRLVPAFADS